MRPLPTDETPAPRRLAALVGWAGMAMLDLVLPPRCVLCGTVVDRAGALCAECWRKVSFMAEPWCARCGMPFPYDAGADVECAGCIARPPSYDRARSVMIYDDHSRRLILALKHADRLHAVPAFGRWMARTGAELLHGADLIVPVPLHWTRLWHRRYNQSALLAMAIGSASTPAVRPDLLIRTRLTPTQGHRTRRQRAINVRGAFRLKRGALVRGLHIVLVDDVLTSGATVEECAKVLRRAGASRIDVLTLARAVRTA